MGVPRALGHAAPIALALIASGASAQTRSQTQCFTVGGVVTCNTETREPPAPLDYGQILQQGRDSVPPYQPRRPEPLPAQKLEEAPFFDIQTGNDLLAACESATGQCVTFISAALGGFNAAYEVAGVPSRICTTDAMSSGQLQDVVIAELRRSPQNRHWPAAALVAYAAMKAFPCGE